MKKYILKIIKKYKLLAKYERTDERMLSDIHLLNIMENDRDFKSWFIHKVYCETRCYKRLKKLK